MKKLAVILGLMSFQAWGYNLTKDFTNGFYWASLPIAVTVIDSDSSRKSLLESLSQQAISEWESRTGLSLWDFKQSGASQASSNIIRWSTNFAKETGMDATTILAVAIRHTSGPYFAKTEIVINGTHAQLQNNSANILTTLTHELGHTMGLDHSGDYSAVMAPTLQSPYYGLASDDVNGMSSAYSTTENRQLTGYISPLSTTKSESSNPLSCGTVTVTSPAATGNGLASLSVGMLIGFVRKMVKWFKSKF